MAKTKWSDLLQDQETPSKFIKIAQETESKYRKVAKFLVLVGGDDAACILSKLDPKQVEAITQEIATIRGITEAEAKGLSAEFRSLLSLSGKYNGDSSGGIEEARKLLHKAFGQEKGEALLRRVVPEATENPFDFLEEFTAEQLSAIFKDDSPAAEAVVLSRLPPKRAAAVINLADPQRKLEIARRIARMNKVAPSVMEQTAAALKEKIRKIGKTDTEEVDGMNALAAILKFSDLSFETKLLDELTVEDPALSYELRARLYTLDDIIKMNDLTLEEKLRNMNERDIALLVRSRNQRFTEKILSNISVQRRSLVREESEIMGAVPRFEADKVAAAFLNWFRDGREDGTILLSDDNDLIL